MSHLQVLFNDGKKASAFAEKQHAICFAHFPGGLIAYRNPLPTVRELDAADRRFRDHWRCKQPQLAVAKVTKAKLSTVVDKASAFLVIAEQLQKTNTLRDKVVASRICRFAICILKDSVNNYLSCILSHTKARQTLLGCYEILVKNSANNRLKADFGKKIEEDCGNIDALQGKYYEKGLGVTIESFFRCLPPVTPTDARMLPLEALQDLASRPAGLNRDSRSVRIAHADGRISEYEITLDALEPDELFKQALLHLGIKRQKQIGGASAISLAGKLASRGQALLKTVPDLSSILFGIPSGLDSQDFVSLVRQSSNDFLLSTELLEITLEESRSAKSREHLCCVLMQVTMELFQAQAILTLLGKASDEKATKELKLSSVCIDVFERKKEKFLEYSQEFPSCAFLLNDFDLLVYQTRVAADTFCNYKPPIYCSKNELEPTEVLKTSPVSTVQ